MTEAAKQTTIRFPERVWEEVVQYMRETTSPSLNDAVVELVEAELRRRKREKLLARLAEHRAAHGETEDSTAYIRSLREGGWRDE